MEKFEGSKDEIKDQVSKILVNILEKSSKNEQLLKEDISFLYETRFNTGWFGLTLNEPINKVYGLLDEQQKKDLERLLSKRDIKSDLSVLTGFPREQISTTNDEAVSGGIKYHYGDLSFAGTRKLVEGLKLPETVNGTLNFWSIIKTDGLEGVELPKIVGGDLVLSNLDSAKGLKLPERIGGTLYLAEHKSAEGVEFPKIVDGSIDLVGLRSIKGLKLPEHVGGVVDFRLPKADIEELKKQYPNLKITNG